MRVPWVLSMLPMTPTSTYTTSSKQPVVVPLEFCKADTAIVWIGQRKRVHALPYAMALRRQQPLCCSVRPWSAEHDHMHGHACDHAQQQHLMFTCTFVICSMAATALASPRPLMSTAAPQLFLVSVPQSLSDGWTMSLSNKTLPGGTHEAADVALLSKILALAK